MYNFVWTDFKYQRGDDSDELPQFVSDIQFWPQLLLFNIKIGGLTNGGWEVVDSKVKIFIKRMLNNSIETNRRPSKSKVIQANYFIATWESETLHPMRTWGVLPTVYVMHKTAIFAHFKKFESLLRKCIWKGM